LLNGCPYKYAFLLGQTKKKFYNFCIPRNKLVVITNKPQKGPNISYYPQYGKILHTNYFLAVRVRSFNAHYMTQESNALCPKITLSKV
jgi:hypothetical protein